MCLKRDTSIAAVNVALLTVPLNRWLTLLCKILQTDVATSVSAGSMQRQLLAAAGMLQSLIAAVQ